MMHEPQTDLNVSSNPPENTVDTQKTAPSQDPYEAVSLPEDSLISTTSLDSFKKWALEAHLSESVLQKWLAAEEQRLHTLAQQQTQQQEEQQAQWARQTQELLGPQWQEEISRAVRAADLFGGQELRKLLEETGLGNHPAIVRTFHAVAQCISEDVTPGGSDSVTADKTFTQALYGKN